MDHPRDWDLFTNYITYAYNTQVQRTTKIAPFEQVLSRPPPHLALESKPELEDGISRRDYYLLWMSRLRSLMATAKKQMTSEQLRYKADFEDLFRIPIDNVKTGSQVFIHNDYSPTDDPKHYLAPISTEPYEVTEVDENTCVIVSDNNITERVTLDRVVLAPQGATEQLPDQPPPDRGIFITEDVPTTPGVITHSVGVPNVSNDSEEPSAQFPSEINQGAYCTIQRVVSHDSQPDGTNLYQVRW